MDAVAAVAAIAGVVGTVIVAKPSPPSSMASSRRTARKSGTGVLLTYEQVRAYELSATEGKRGDPRWPAFARRYGFDPRRPVQWEVEALEPAELRRLVLAAVDPYIDRSVLAEQIVRGTVTPRPVRLSRRLGRGGRSVAVALDRGPLGDALPSLLLLACTVDLFTNQTGEQRVRVVRSGDVAAAVADYFATEGLPVKRRTDPCRVCGGVVSGLAMPDSVQRTRWAGSWTGRRTGAEGPCWSRSARGAADAHGVSPEG